MKGAVLYLVLGVISVKSTLKDCVCNDFINNNGYGQCKKGISSSFNGSVLCYIIFPTGCSDSLESKTDAGKWSSAEACRIMSRNGSSFPPWRYDAGCICNNFLNTNGFGQCKKGHSSIFDGAALCYVSTPSSCTDLVESSTATGKWLSAQACTKISSHQFDEDSEEGEKFYILNADGQIECDETVHCPPQTSTPFNCTSDEKNGKQFHVCQSNIYKYKCDRSDSVCKEIVCTRKCHSSEDYQPREVIHGREYGCVEDCSDTLIDRCNADGMCPEFAGGIVTIDVSAAASLSTKPSRSRNKCPHGFCKRRNVCCPLSYFHRRRIYVCPYSCG